MISPRSVFIPVGDHELHVTEWGDRNNPAIAMWHGLARTGRDFDELAARLSERYFVLCPDTIGRGLSSWASDPAREYSVSNYAQIAEAMLDAFGIAKTGWIGTSLGGLIGMRLASETGNDRLNWLIINDIGPEVPQAAIDRILEYASVSPSFASVKEAEAWFRTIYAPFGEASKAYWQRMAETSVRRNADGGFTTHYDPRVTDMFTASADELTSWDRYERISVPTHVFRGASSDLLLEEIVERMQNNGPRPTVDRIDDCGHAPSLTRTQDIERVVEVIGYLENRLN